MDLVEPEKEFLQLLPASIDLQPFIQADGFSPTTQLKIKPTPGEVILVPRQVPGVTKEESLDLLAVYLNFITDKPINFDQWFTWYKQYFMTAFYPFICKHIGLLTPDDGTLDAWRLPPKTTNQIFRAYSYHFFIPIYFTLLPLHYFHFTSTPLDFTLLLAAPLRLISSFSRLWFQRPLSLRCASAVCGEVDDLVFE